MQPKIDEMKV